jgi:hypothetical protein
MRNALRGPIAAVVGAGILVFASPTSANPYAYTEEEISWGDEYGEEMVCDVFAASPNAAGIKEVMLTVMDAGWDMDGAGRVAGYTLGTHCPDLLRQWVKAIDDL